MMKRYLLFFLLLVFAGLGRTEAQVRVTGKVTDSSTGESVPTVTVFIRGTNNAVTTDNDGNYAITVPDNNAVLVFSLVGFAGVEVVASSSVLNVALTPETMLGDVIVTALGISKEAKALAYSVQSIKSEQLIQAASTDLASAMQGKVSGVHIKPSSGMPGASAQITIRGARSFTGNNTPLYVVDGMPIASTADVGTGNSVTSSDFANRAVDIDPNDIESINILKGQAASALYGIRASNGVILITTKSGKGLAKGKAHISFSSNVSVDKIARYPKMQSRWAQGDGGLAPAIFAASGAISPGQASTSWGPLISELPNDPRVGGNIDSEAVTRIANGNRQPGKYYVRQREFAGLDPWVTPQTYDNIRDFFGTGVNWSNSLNIAQSTESSSYSLSLGNVTQNGIVPGTDMNRVNAKLAAETKLSKNWKSGFSGNFVTTKINKLPSANDGIVATVYPAPPNYDLKGIPSHYAGNPYRQNNYRAGAFPQPYWALDNNVFAEGTNRFFGSAYVDYVAQLAEKHRINVKYQLGADMYTSQYDEIWGYGNRGSGDQGSIETFNWSKLAVNSTLTASYDWDISDDLKFNALLGNEFIQNRRKLVYASGMNFVVPGWNHIDNTSVKDNSEAIWKDRTVGFFANLSLSYKNMLFLNLTGRNDYVSTMPSGNHSFFYPSVSAAFVLTELDALKNNDFLSFAKLRASYAQVGQAGSYTATPYGVPAYGSGFYMLTPLLYPIRGTNAYTMSYTVNDPALVPQNTSTIELGIDLNFFKNLIGVNYTFSRQDVVDQIFSIPMASSTGFGAKYANGGSVHTNTHEVTLSANPVRTKSVDWSLAFNFTKIDNYVDELAEGVESIFMGGFVTPQVRASIGDKYPVIYGTTFLRDDNGNLIVDSRGFPQAGAPGVIGHVSPDFLLGFNTSLSLFGKLNLAAVIDWKSGGQMYSGTNNLLDMYGVSKATDDRDTRKYVVPGVKADGSKNDIVIEGPGTSSTGWQGYYNAVNGVDEASIYDNSFVKLREISAGYLILNRPKLQLTVSAFARNILLWTNYPNFDPEASQGNNNMTGAFERFSLPQTSSFGFGINVKF